MKNSIMYIAAAIALAAFVTGELSAQQLGGGHPGGDRFSVNVHGGGFFATSSLGAATEFDDTGTVGGNATLWLHRNVGVRASVLWAQPDVIDERVFTQTNSSIAREDPDVWLYSGDLVLRLPLAGGNFTWFPYAVGGFGGKTYDFATLSSATDFAGNFGAGVELRFGHSGRWGINTEVRDFVSSFDRLGFDETLHDVIWTGGISLTF